MCPHLHFTVACRNVAVSWHFSVSKNLILLLEVANWDFLGTANWNKISLL